MNDKKEFLATEPIGKLLFKLSIPTVVAQLIYIMPSLLADKTQAVYMAEPVADIIAVTFTAILFTFQFKKALKEITEV